MGDLFVDEFFFEHALGDFLGDGVFEYHMQLDVILVVDFKGLFGEFDGVLETEFNKML